MGQSAIDFQVDGERVGGVLSFPDGGMGPVPGVVVCHPHPLFGGNMDSALVWSICGALASRGIASLRFNFRRPGAEPEQLNRTAAQDVLAAFDVLRSWEAVDGRRCGLAGFSFGAAVIARQAGHMEAARALALVAPPVASVRDSAIGSDERPRYFLAGGRDRLVDASELADLVSSMRGDTTFEVLEGADHSMAAHHAAAAERVAGFLAERLSA